MKPKTEIKFSYKYQSMLGFPLSVLEFKKLIHDSEGFLKLYNIYIDKILSSIERCHEEWDLEYIPIYIISGEMKSFSDPLTLRYRDDHKFMLLILIHELLHNNFKRKFRDPSTAHEVINEVFPKVLKDLDLKGFDEAIQKYNRIFYPKRPI